MKNTKKRIGEEKAEPGNIESAAHSDSNSRKTNSKTEVTVFNIQDIVIDPTVNIRHEALSLDAVDSYSENPNLPPVDVMLVDGRHYLADGEHRLHGALKRGDKTIKAVVVGGSTLDELREHADLANLRHGLPLTRAQKREVARRLHLRHPKWSRRRLGKVIGVSHPTITAWLDPGQSKKTGKNLPPSSVGPETSVAGVEVTPPPSGVPATVSEASETATIRCPKCGYEIPVS